MTKFKNNCLKTSILSRSFFENGGRYDPPDLDSQDSSASDSNNWATKTQHPHKVSTAVTSAASPAPHDDNKALSTSTGMDLTTTLGNNFREDSRHSSEPSRSKSNHPSSSGFSSATSNQVTNNCCESSLQLNSEQSGNSNNKEDNNNSGNTDNLDSLQINGNNYNEHQHMYLNDIQGKEMIFRNPHHHHHHAHHPHTSHPQMSSLTTVTSTTPGINYPTIQRTIWNTNSINGLSQSAHQTGSTQPPLQAALSPSPLPYSDATTTSGNGMVDSPPSTLVLPTLKKRKRPPQPIPDECKDNAYWERRKRNNESAKRSREMRRVKEQQTNMRVIYLEQDNLRLKTEVDMLRNEVEKLRDMLYNRRETFSTENKFV